MTHAVFVLAMPFLLVLVQLPSHARHAMPHLASFKQRVSNQALLSLPKICVMQNDVGMFRVDAHQLKTALLPSPTALLAQLGQCLPRAAAQLYAVFVDQVHSATSILKASISSVEDYVHQLAFLETLKVRVLRTCVSLLLLSAMTIQLQAAGQCLFCWRGDCYSAHHVLL